MPNFTDGSTSNLPGNKAQSKTSKSMTAPSPGSTSLRLHHIPRPQMSDLPMQSDPGHCRLTAEFSIVSDIVMVQRFGRGLWHARQ